MKRRLLVTALLVAGLAMALTGCGETSAGGDPEITVLYEGSPVNSGDNIQLGHAGPTAVLHTFTIRNDGTAILSLTAPVEIVGDDEIQITPPPVDAIDPGSTADVIASLQHLGNDVDVFKTVTVYSDDPDEPTFELYLSGFVASYIS